MHDQMRTRQVYTKLRKESAISAGMPIAVRHLESMIRMSEAHAKMHLRKQVSDADIDTAVRCAFLWEVLLFLGGAFDFCNLICQQLSGVAYSVLLAFVMADQPHNPS